MKTQVIAALAALAVLPACVSQQTSNTSAQAAPQSAESALAASAGLNVASAKSKVNGAAAENVANTGLAVGMTQSFGGAGLGFGLLGVLAGSGGGLEASPHILASAAGGGNPKSREKAYSEAVYKASGLNLEAKGYKRVQSANAPSAVTYAQEGCPVERNGAYKRSCSQVFMANVYRPQGASAGTGYMVNYAVPFDVRDYEAFARRIVNQHPKELALYIPPKRQNGQLQPAKMLQNGKETEIR